MKWDTPALERGATVKASLFPYLSAELNVGPHLGYTDLKLAALKLKQAGVKLLIEPINTIDIPGFYLNYSKQALELIEEVGSENLFLQYDIYHMQVMEGDLARTIEKNLARIAHMQLADNPGRNEPGTGEINYEFLFSHIDRIGYAGWIGAEYKPKAGTEAGLGWFRSLTAKGSAAA